MPNPAAESWLDDVWPRLTAATGVGYVAVAYGVSRWLTRPSPATVSTTLRFAMARVEPLQCVTCDGILLQGWVVEPPAPRATVALFHGLRGNRSALVERIDFLTRAGYRCVAFDHRAHGESGGAFASFGYHERHDAIAVAELILSRWSDQPCAAMGISMGAAALCFAGRSASGFQALILESMYYDLHRAFHHRVGCGYPGWLRHFRRGIIWFIERRLNARIEQIAPVDQMAGLAPRPVLLITGGDDPHAPPNEVQALAEKLPGAAFQTVPGTGHGDVCDLGGAFYRDLILGFLGEQLFTGRLSSAA